MKHKKLYIALIVVLSLSNLLLLFVIGVTPTDHSISLIGGIRHLEFYVAGRHDPSLADIEVGMTLEEVEEMIPDLDGKVIASALSWVYLHEGQRAYITLNSQGTIVGYVIYGQQRNPLKVDLVHPQNALYSQMVTADLADADFEKLTLFDILEQYGFAYGNAASLGYTNRVFLDDGRLLYMSGSTIQFCSAYKNFTGCQPGDAILWRNNDPLRPITADTFMRRVEILDLFDLEPGMNWSDLEPELLCHDSEEEHDRKNSEYFLNWIANHQPK